MTDTISTRPTRTSLPTDLHGIRTGKVWCWTREVPDAATGQLGQRHHAFNLAELEQGNVRAQILYLLHFDGDKVVDFREVLGKESVLHEAVGDVEQGADPAADVCQDLALHNVTKTQ